MNMFDVDGNGLLSYHEFRMLLKSMGGLKTYNQEIIKHKK